MSDKICSNCGKPDPNGEWWDDLCQMCWEEESSKKWWEMVAEAQLEDC